MKKAALFTAATFLAGLFLAGTPLAAGEYGKTGTGDQQQTRTGQQLGAQQQAGMQAGQQQIRTASAIQKFNVETATGERLGKVDKVVVDMDQGQIGYIIVSAAEGTDTYIIPWKALEAKPRQQSLVLNISAEMLKQAPKGDVQQVLDRQRGREIHQFYGVSPYWEESGLQKRMQRDQMQQPGEIQQRDHMQQPGAERRM